MKKLYTSLEFNLSGSRDLLPLKCQSCGLKFKVTKHNIQKAISGLTSYSGKYCSLACAHKDFKTGKVIKCGWCKLNIYRRKSDFLRHSSHFCSRSCMMHYKNKIEWVNKPPSGWTQLKIGYRIKAIREYGFKCSNSKCKLKHVDMPSFMYEVDHINGKHRDNRIENLQVLCVWCHRLKTFGDKK